jgi:hypothetical protein
MGLETGFAIGMLLDQLTRHAPGSLGSPLSGLMKHMLSTLED